MGVKKATAIFPTIQKLILIDCIVGQPDSDNPMADEKAVICKALIDTGAMITAISKRVADFMQLPVTGSQAVTAANNHTDIVNTHIINITMGGDVRFNLVQSSCIEMDDEEDMIIGMDLLSQGTLILSNKSGKTVFMFEIEQE